MGLLFRPRCPPPWAADTMWPHASWCSDVAIPDSGDVRADLEELARALAPAHLGQVGAFSDIELFVDVEIDGDAGYAEWVLMARHTGRLVIGATEMVEATGDRVTLRGVTVVDLVDGHIGAHREYVDELALLNGLGLLPEPDRPIS
jgi:SnoaL-like polyketide cyclase